MKKLIITILVALLLIPSNAFAAFQPPPSEAYLAAYYNSWRNEYRAVYSKWMPDIRFDTVRVYFENSIGTPYQRNYTAAIMANASAYWLTCNGQYQFQYLQNGVIVAHSPVIVTTDIVAPSCDSYADGGSSDDANANYQQNPDGSYKLNWSDIPGSNSYEIWKDGVLIDTVAADPSGQYTTNIPYPGGGISIVGKDGSGDYTGHSDINVPDDLYGEYPSACSVCDKIAAALECPEWDTYMGELTGAIKNALPTLPEWRNIADQFVDAFDDYFGDPPAVPNPTNITPEIPALNTSVPDADINIELPDEFDTPLLFDVTTAPVIPVLDESEPFEIYEPDEYIDSDGPGVFVYPGDSRNSSGGIKQPDDFVSPYPQPVPTLPAAPDPGDPPEIPPADIPIPSGSTGTTPTPTVTGGEMAFPTIPDGGE